MKKQYLSEFMLERKNNLDVIRFIAAILVIFSHAYPLLHQNNNNEPLYYLTNQMTFGMLAVSVFFIISGFLIAQSFERSSSIFRYYQSRILRIFPALIVCIIFSAFIIGPLMSTFTFSEYFTDSSTYKYLIGITLLPNLSPNLPGVFENNPYGNFVNGSLWTLKFEFLCYISVAIIGMLGLLNKKFVGLIFILTTILSLFEFGDNLNNLFLLSSYFFGGSLAYLYRDKIKISEYHAIGSFVVLIICSQFGLFTVAIAIFGTYLIFYLGYQQHIKLHNFSKFGDFSYGIYIYAFPIQQSVIYVLGDGISPLQNFIISLPFVLVLSILSWHLVEKRALKLKKIPFQSQNKTTHKRLA